MILNVGCGGGRASDKATYLGDVRIDLKRFPSVTIIMDAHHLGFRASTFDEVYCFEVLEHLESPIKALKELKRVLKDEGSITVTVPNVWYWRYIYRALSKRYNVFDDPPPTDHKQAWDIYEFHSLAYQGGFKIVEVRWLDWYPRGKLKLDPVEPILRKILPAAFYYTHTLFKLKL